MLGNHTMCPTSLTSVSVLLFFVNSCSAHSGFVAGDDHTLVPLDAPSTCTDISVTTCISRSATSCDCFVISNESSSVEVAAFRLRVLRIVAYCRGPAFLLRALEDIAPGMKRVKIGRRRGRQEQIMPTLISTELHVAAGGLSYVGSIELEMATSEWSRSIETMQTLLCIR